MMKKSSVSQEILTRAVEEVIVRDHVEAALASGKKLRVKFGIDPTAPDLHLGHTVPLRKLRAFQEAGHQAVLIIGDFTATVGDPSGRSDTRTPLTEKAVRANMKKYLAQASQIIDLKKTEVRYNSEWYKKAGIGFLYDLLSKVTVQRALERDDFQKRIGEGHDLSIIEMVYPLLQGYDSVAVRADVEIGGTDQKFNLLSGRKIQRRFGHAEQDVLTLWLIEGTDGVRKMSKSLGNYIGLLEAPDSMFGKIMSVPDEIMEKYFVALTDMPLEQIAQIRRALEAGEATLRDTKLLLAEWIVRMYHGEKKALGARNEFIHIFSEHHTPKDIPTVIIPPGGYDPVSLAVKLKLAPSRSEARRLIEYGAMYEITIDGKAIPIKMGGTLEVEKGMIFRKGKRKFARVG